MKKIILITLLIGFNAALFSQSAFRQTVSNPTGAITNTGIDSMYFTLPGVFKLVSIQPLITKATGTMAGTAILSYSVNGSNYVSSDTLTLGNSTVNTVVWNKSTAAKYFRIITGGATTVTALVSAKISISQ